jgi:hypothetical protein
MAGNLWLDKASPAMTTCHLAIDRIQVRFGLLSVIKRPSAAPCVSVENLWTHVRMNQSLTMTKSSDANDWIHRSRLWNAYIYLHNAIPSCNFFYTPHTLFYREELVPHARSRILSFLTWQFRRNVVFSRSRFHPLTLYYDFECLRGARLNVVL